MARGLMRAAIAGTALLLSATASTAAPMAATQEAAVGQNAPSSRDDRYDRSGGAWIVAVLALLAVVGGIVAAATSGDSRPESP